MLEKKEKREEERNEEREEIARQREREKEKAASFLHLFNPIITYVLRIYK